MKRKINQIINPIAKTSGLQMLRVVCMKVLIQNQDCFVPTDDVLTAML